MKKLLFILLTLISIQSFAQDTTYVKVRGIPGAYNFSKNAGGDSLIFYVSGVRHALPIGSQISFGQAVDSNYLKISNNNTVDTLKVIINGAVDNNVHISTDATFSNAGDDSVPSSLAVKKYARGIVDTVTNITTLENYTGFANVVIVKDTLRGGVFHYVSYGLTPDSGIVFKAYNGGYWRRVWDFLKVNVAWFGASNDGVTDATNGIQAAIDFLDINKGGKGGTVYFPTGKYIVSHTIYFGNKVNLEGTWWSTIQFATGATGNMFQNPLSGQIGYFYVRGLQLYGNDQNGTAIAILYNGSLTSDIYFDNLLINHWNYDGINITNGWQIHISQSIIEYIGGATIRLAPSGTVAIRNVRRVYISNNGLYKKPIDTTSATIDMNGNLNANSSMGRWIIGVYMTNNRIENSGAFQPTIRIQGVLNSTITGNHIVNYPDVSKNNLISNIYIDSSGLGTISGNTIESWLEYGNTSGSTYVGKNGIYLTDSSFNWTFGSNTFWHTGTDSIHIDASCYNISRPIIVDSLRNNAGVLEMRKNGTFVPQFTLPTGASGSYLPLSGGTMTGAILPNAAASLSLGSSSFGWLNTYSYSLVSPNDMTLQAISGLMSLKLGGTTYALLKNNNATGVTNDGTNLLQLGGSIKATQYRLSALNTAPTSSTDTGTLGEIRVTAGYIYICTATNTWVRAALSTW